MPIDIDSFEDAEVLREPPTGERILRFLLVHDDNAYTRTRKRSAPTSPD